MNLDKVLDKVNEVKFYSEKLHDVHNSAVPGNPDEFRYYFSAFLNAVYSVQQFAKTKAMEELQRQSKKNRAGMAENRHLRHDSIIPWQSTSNAPVQSVKATVVPERKLRCP